jgi:hypothetical protein
MLNDASFEGFRLCFGRGRSLSVISARTMIADMNDNLIGCLQAKLLNAPGGWSKAKERMRQHLDHQTRNHRYVGAWIDSRDYQLTRVGPSYLYDVPLEKRGILALFVRKWVRVGPVRHGCK